MGVRTGNGLKLLLLLSLAGCAHGSNAPTTTRATTAAAAAPEQRQDYSNYYPPGTHKPTSQALRVITRWSEELRRGHVRRAASYFAVPVVVQNASPVLKLTSRAEVLGFNRTLPCGAHIVKTIAGGRYTVATFVLTERPGSPGCGATGMLAATAFRLRHGKISEWRRVLVPPPLGPAQNLRGGAPVS